MRMLHFHRSSRDRTQAVRKPHPSTYYRNHPVSGNPVKEAKRKTMSKKEDKAAIANVSALLKEKGITFDPAASLQTLQGILSSHERPQDQHVPKAGAAVPDALSHDSIEIADPEILRPRVLPLVIKPKGKVDEEDPLGGWANESACAFAKTLNGYAYKNPKKWGKKRNGLVAQLVELNTLPADEAAEKLITLNGGNIGVNFTDKRIAPQK